MALGPTEAARNLLDLQVRTLFMRRNSTGDSTLSNEALPAGGAIGDEWAGVEAIPLGPTTKVDIRRGLVKLGSLASSHDLVSRGAGQ